MEKNVCYKCSLPFPKDFDLIYYDQECLCNAPASTIDECKEIAERGGVPRVSVINALEEPIYEVFQQSKKGGETKGKSQISEKSKTPVKRQAPLYPKTPHLAATGADGTSLNEQHCSTVSPGNSPMTGGIWDTPNNDQSLDSTHKKTAAISSRSWRCKTNTSVRSSRGETAPNTKQIEN